MAGYAETLERIAREAAERTRQLNEAAQAQQWATQAPPTQPPPQATLYPAAPPPPPQPQVVDRVAYLQEQRNRAAQALQAIQPLQEAIETYSEYGRLARERGGYEPGSYANPATEAYARTQFEQAVPREMGGLGILETLNKPIPYAQDVIGEIAQTPERLGRAVDTALAYATNRRLGETGSERVERAMQTEGTLTEAGRELEPATRLAAEFLIPQQVWELAVELSPLGTVADLRAAFKEGVPAAIKAVREAAEQTGETQLVRRLASETGALGGKGEPEDILAASVRAEDAGSGTPALTTDNPLPSPVPDTVIAALKNRNAAVAKDPDAFQQAWEVLPAENQKMILKMADAVLTPAERKAITRAGQARQTARAREAIEETAGSTLERAQAARQAMAGRYIPQINPIGESFTDDEIVSLFNQIDQAFDARTIIPQEHANATDAMQLLMYGSRPLSPDKPLSLMPHEVKLLGRIYGPAFEAMLPKNKRELSAFQKAIDIANLPRAIISGIDVSAPGRQGIVLAARNPVEWGKAWGPMVKSMLSENRWTKELNRIQTDEYFEDATLHGIDFTDIGGGAEAEEAFASRIIQGNLVLRNTVGRGERGYTTYLNRLRLDVYKKYAQRLERLAAKQNWSAERLDLAKKDFAGFVNHASGRGDLSKLNEYTPAMNALFFSPRFVVSRPQAVWDLVKPGVDPAVRQMVGENLGAFVGSGVLLLTTLAATGLAAVELDPRSSDFGKIRVGNQRIEFWGGFQPLARYIAQVSLGQRKPLGGGELVDINRGQTLGRFLRSKLSPAGALGWDILIEGGRNYEGESFLNRKQLPQEAMNRLTPLVLQDAIEGYRSQGPLAALSAAGLSAVGGGVGTFEATEETKKAQERDKFESDFAEKFPEVQEFPNIAVQRAKNAYPDWPFEGETYEEAIEALKADAEKKGVRYQDMAVYKDIQKRIETANLNARKQDPEVDAYWVILNGAKPMTREAQRIVKELTGITVELRQE